MDRQNLFRLYQVTPVAICNIADFSIWIALILLAVEAVLFQRFGLEKGRPAVLRTFSVFLKEELSCLRRRQ